MPILATLRANLAAALLGLLTTILLIIAIVQTIQIHGFGIWPLKIPGLKAKYETSLKKLNDERSGRAEDRRRYTKAQRDAKAKNEADVARIEADQQRISDNVQSDLSARLERLRSELRSATPKGVAGRPKAGPDVSGSPGADEKAGLCLTPEELLSAAESEERYDQLITLIKQQQGVKR